MAAEHGAARVVVYLTEDDRVGRRRAEEVLVERARTAGLSGATVWRGVEGFGRSGKIRTARFADAGFGLPLALEVVDRAEKNEVFLAMVSELVPGALVTREEVRVVDDEPDRAALS